MKPELLFASLVENLRLLAVDVETQIRSLPDFVDVPDEVAMGFGDAFLVADQILEAGLIDETAWKKMKALDDYLSEMSDDPTLWTVDALRDNPRWKEARLRANDILDYLHAPIRPPDPSMV